MTDDATCPAARQQAAELILQDERLSADLVDQEAELLLGWALSAAERAAAARLASGEPAGRADIADAVQPVRQTARAVNDLVAQHTQMDRYEFLRQLLALVDSACRLAPGLAPSGKPPAPSSARVPSLSEGDPCHGEAQDP